MSSRASTGWRTWLGADEAFLASTTREIQGVSSLDGSSLPEAPGPVTARASAALREAIDAELG